MVQARAHACLTERGFAPQAEEHLTEPTIFVVRGQLFLALHYAYMHFEALKSLDPLDLERQQDETKTDADFGSASFPARIKALALGILLADGVAIHTALQSLPDHAFVKLADDYQKASHLSRATFVVFSHAITQFDPAIWVST
jgi:hypothetical protein